MVLMKEFAPVVIVTGAYFLLFYIFMCFQSFSKFFIYFAAKSKSKKEDKEVSFKQIKYGSTSGLGFISDRTFMNMLEQSPAFLVSLWLHAVFVSCQTAATAGWIYIAFRALYPVVFIQGPPWLFISTFANYFVVCYLLGSTVLIALSQT